MLQALVKLLDGTRGMVEGARMAEMIYNIFRMDAIGWRSYEMQMDEMQE